MRTRAEWHLNSRPMTHDVHELVWNLEIDCMSVWCLCVVTEGICVVIIWCSWLSKGAPHKSLCKSILVISAKASSYHLFMREWTSVSHNPRVLFSSLALFYEEVSGLIPPTTLLFLCPVRSFFAALGAVNPWLQFPLSGGVRSVDYFKAGSHAPAPAHMAALKAGASSRATVDSVCTRPSEVFAARTLYAEELLTSFFMPDASAFQMVHSFWKWWSTHFTLKALVKK